VHICTQQHDATVHLLNLPLCTSHLCFPPPCTSTCLQPPYVPSMYHITSMCSHAHPASSSHIHTPPHIAGYPCHCTPFTCTLENKIKLETVSIIDKIYIYNQVVTQVVLLDLKDLRGNKLSQSHKLWQHYQLCRQCHILVSSLWS
jgi:hypothetical protein